MSKVIQTHCVIRVERVLRPPLPPCKRRDGPVTKFEVKGVTGRGVQERKIASTTVS
jgi:hypothetical protein